MRLRRQAVPWVAQPRVHSRHSRVKGGFDRSHACMQGTSAHTPAKIRHGVHSTTHTPRLHKETACKASHARPRCAGLLTLSRVLHAHQHVAHLRRQRQAEVPSCRQDLGRASRQLRPIRRPAHLADGGMQAADSAKQYKCEFTPVLSAARRWGLAPAPAAPPRSPHSWCLQMGAQGHTSQPCSGTFAWRAAPLMCLDCKPNQATSKCRTDAQCTPASQTYCPPVRTMHTCGSGSDLVPLLHPPILHLH